LETLFSVKEQQYQNWECIIVDDRSTDGTHFKVRDFISDDSRFSFHIRDPKITKGANSCRNIGIDLAQGEWIQFLDSDDLLASNKLQSQVSALDDEVDVFFSGYAYFTHLNEISSLSFIKKPFYKNYDKGVGLLEALGENDGLLPQHSYLIRKSILNQSGKWNLNIRSNQDGEFFSRVLVCSNSVKYVDKGIAFYRLHSGVRQSALKSKEVLNNRILSWKLIEKTLSEKGYKRTKYVLSAKKIILRKAVEIDPKIILKNLFFFRPRLVQIFTSKLSKIFN